MITKKTTFFLLILSLSSCGVIEYGNIPEKPDIGDSDLKKIIQSEKEDRQNTRLKTLPPKYKNEYSSKYPLEK